MAINSSVCAYWMREPSSPVHRATPAVPTCTRMHCARASDSHVARYHPPNLQLLLCWPKRSIKVPKYSLATQRWGSEIQAKIGCSSSLTPTSLWRHCVMNRRFSSTRTQFLDFLDCFLTMFTINIDCSSTCKVPNFPSKTLPCHAVKMWSFQQCALLENIIR